MTGTQVEAPIRAEEHLFWTTKEEQVLRERYQSGGAIECSSELPNRTILSIYAHAAKIGLKTSARKPPYKSSEHIDQAIRVTYQSTPKKGDIEALASRIMRPRWWVSRRAWQLGLVVPRFKEEPWSDVELELLDRHAHKNPEVIKLIFKKNGYERTATAIVNKRKRLELGLKLNPDPDHLTARQVAGLMGVDSGTVKRWIELEGLPAVRQGTKRTPQQGGDLWRINVRKLRLWIGSHAVQVDLRKVDRFWFIDLMANR
ncbi:hypothetical protein SAMN05720354_103136 [Nitrosospira sp. Nsp1]|nr:hypothetical protein SAMN05720354_103136 [Nitrosospira sp. Nsp1]